MKRPLRKVLINTLEKLHLANFARKLRIILRKVIGTDRKIKNHYLLSCQVKKLHIGCGGHFLKDWLNTDLLPGKGVMYLDAIKPFAFEDSTFDYIFSEHMLEHIPYLKGLHMLSECYRILKPGGKIRIATPDLQFFVTLYQQPNKTEPQKKFIKYAVDKWIPHAEVHEDTFIINAYVRMWGHQFIYDEKVLRYTLEKVGFSNITRVKTGVSDDAELRSLENEKRAPPGIVEVHSMILEAMKP